MRNKCLVVWMCVTAACSHGASVLKLMDHSVCLPSLTGGWKFVVGGATLQPRLRGGFDVAGQHADYVREVMEVPAERIGIIIGRQGATIKEIGRQAGVNMWVDPKTNLPGHPQRFIYLHGAPANIAVAKSFVRDCLESGDSTILNGDHSIPPLSAHNGGHQFFGAGGEDYGNEGGVGGGGGEEYEGYPGALGGGEVRIGQDGTV